MRYKNIIVYFLCVASISITYASATSKPKSSSMTKLVSNNKATEQCNMQLSLDKVFKMVKENHPVIKAIIINNKISDAELLSSKGAFDVNISTRGYYNRYNSSSDIGEQQHARMYQAELELLTRYGLEIAAGAQLNDGDIKTPITPTGEDGEYFASINAPLLRDAWYNQSSVREKLAGYNVNRVYNNYRLAAIDILLQANTTYWDWLASQNKLKIEKLLYKNAEFRLDAVEKMAKSGDLAMIDITEAKQELKMREGRVYYAERQYQNYAYQLSWFLWDRNSSQTTNVLSCPPHEFKVNLLSKKDYEPKTGKIIALQKRPELKNIQILAQIADVERSFAKNDLLPELDIFLKAGSQQGAGSINGMSVKSGVSFSLPIQRREAKGRVKKFSLELEKLELEERQTIQKVFLQIDDAVSAIDMAIKRFKVASEEVQFAEKMEEGENIRFKQGDSTLFVVNRRERATAEAKNRLVDIMKEYYQAVAYYRAAVGDLI